jgi:NADH-quinone oxidoreductase subunit L
MTAFYMFRLWYMTFAGKPRNPHRYDHAHESPAVMTRPLLVLAFFAIAVGWTVPFTNVSVTNLLHQAQPLGVAAGGEGAIISALTIPAEELSHAADIKFKAGLAAFGAAMTGLLMATVIYLWKALDPAEIRQTFRPIYALLWNKWYFDEMYRAALVRPTMALGRQIAAFDRRVIDELIHGLAWF